MQDAVSDTTLGDYTAGSRVGNRVIIERKLCAASEPGHRAPLLSYLPAAQLPDGLLLNFRRPKLEYRRFSGRA
jgi:GxxExxY protein